MHCYPVIFNCFIYVLALMQKTFGWSLHGFLVMHTTKQSLNDIDLNLEYNRCHVDVHVLCGYVSDPLPSLAYDMICVSHFANGGISSSLLGFFGVDRTLHMGHFFNMATIQEETIMKQNHEKGTFINWHEHV